jgi:hypothetical protein
MVDPKLIDHKVSEWDVQPGIYSRPIPKFDYPLHSFSISLPCNCASPERVAAERSGATCAPAAPVWRHHPPPVKTSLANADMEKPVENVRFERRPHALFISDSKNQNRLNSRIRRLPVTARENKSKIPASPIHAIRQRCSQPRSQSSATAISRPAVVAFNREKTMISDKQIEANRANALLSTGPTEDGKKRSRLNALRHGITGQVTTMTDEDRAAHDKLSQALMKDLAPEGAMEIQLAQRIATDSWRLNRISAVEDNLFALGLHEHGGKLSDHEQIDAALTTAHVFTLESKQLQLLTLYEQRINRTIHKNLALLQSLQSTRKAQRDAAMKEAVELLKLSEMRGLEYSPGRDGFIFSTAEIHAAIDRQQRLQRSSTTDFSKYKPRKFQTQAA